MSSGTDRRVAAVPTHAVFNIPEDVLSVLYVWRPNELGALNNGVHCTTLTRKHVPSNIKKTRCFTYPLSMASWTRLMLHGRFDLLFDRFTFTLPPTSCFAMNATCLANSTLPISNSILLYSRSSSRLLNIA